MDASILKGSVQQAGHGRPWTSRESIRQGQLVILWLTWNFWTWPWVNCQGTQISIF